MSDPALQRIRRFSRATWVIGTVVIGVVAFFVVPGIGLVGDGIVVDVDGNGTERVYPHLADDPAELEFVDGVVTGGRDGGWIPFDADAEPLMIRRPASHDDTDHVGNDYITVFHTADEAAFDADGEFPASLSALWDSQDVVYATPALTDGRLWFSAIDGTWEVLAEPVETTAVVDGAATGSDDALLSYRGDALSARFTHTGPGFLRVTVYSPEFEYRGTPAVNDVDEFTTRASWPIPGTVLFMIESSGGEWSVAVDE